MNKQLEKIDDLKSLDNFERKLRKEIDKKLELLKEVPTRRSQIKFARLNQLQFDINKYR